MEYTTLRASAAHATALGPGRKLRQIHFAEVVGMRLVDLLEHRFALGPNWKGRGSQKRGSYQEQQVNPVSLGQGSLQVSA